ncbi:deubiquitinating protein VCPIP1-like isoform X2 [Lineus longissimus]|uniref:deubiquitinating protein VCPIP1-like isoform X2 n=1 Tax=Lineus longissimus TaxID=88925 RepID=UPI00315D8CEE
MASGASESKEKYRVLSGCCPDEKCKTKLFFPGWEPSIECTNCGQRHEQKNLHNVEKVTNQEVALHNMLKNVLLGNSKPKKGTDTIKVLGLSNYHCKLLSPLLSKYGMDKTSGKAKLLKDMGQGEQFDCGVLCDRAFHLDQEHLDVNGFGRDQTSMEYLAETLEAMSQVNENEDRLIPIHADGDGHCLVHAISRSLVGRELFWYPLRDNLLAHFEERFSEYSEHFKDFIDTEEWKTIIAECDTAFIPPDGEALGLRNIHILGLANVLRRPIILLDSLSGLQSSGDYSGVFLPAMIPREKCIGKDGHLNKPLCIAWSSSGRNHYIPLVGLKGKPQPRVPRWMIPQAWGLPNELVNQYIEFDALDACVIGGDKVLQDRYIQRLCKAMEEVFVERHAVHPSLVADVHQYVYKSTGIVGVRPEEVLETSQKAVQEGRLYRCLLCDAISELTIDPEWLQSGGMLYNLLASESDSHGKLKSHKTYSVPSHGLVCKYEPEKDCLIPDLSACELTKCNWCHGGQMRRVNPDGSPCYINGDRTSNRAGKTRCQCGFKHYWDGKEYDNLPEVFPISLEWTGKVIVEKVVWWQYETDTSLNSNVFEVAQELVQKHFPGEFGSERLVQKVVDTILQQTALKPEMSESACSNLGPDPMDTGWRDDTASKIILTGHAHKSIHKEQLTMSETEKEIRQKVTQNAAQQQKRKSMELSRMQEKASQFPQKKPQSGSDGQSPSDSPLSSPRTPPLTSPRTPTEKKIRLQTSDGRTMMISLDMALTYHTLQERIASELNIPLDKQKIRHGFPPKELAPPSEGKENEPLVLQHGDKLAVEILPGEKPLQPTKTEEKKEKVPQPKSEDRPTFWPQPPSPPRQSWGLFEQDAHSNTAEDMLRELNQNRSNGDSLDKSIATLALMATLTGRDFWGYVQSMPHLFSIGGLFYKQVDRDIGLTDGKHCTLPCLPGKVFRYTRREDRLELCLEPHGHFPIEPGIEHKVLNENTISKLGHKLTPGEDGNAGASGTAHRPFSGQGHALSCGDKMPKDYKPANAHKARSVKSGTFSADLPAAIEEEFEEGSDGLVTDKAKTEVDLDAHLDKKTTRNKQPGLKRIGPGMSVLDQESGNAVNHQVEFMRARAMSIEAAIAEEEEEEDMTTQGLPSDMELGEEMDTVLPPSPSDRN